METRQVILQLRTAKGLSQEELAAKVYVTRQAVSRWETGETVPNTETLKLLSQLFDVSINTLLGSPRTLVCQCCGMPLDDSTLSTKGRMVPLTRIIVSGAMPMAGSPIPPKLPCWIIWWHICPTRITPPLPLAASSLILTFPS